MRDVSGLGVERNLFRYRRVPVAVRATRDAPWQAVLRVVIAAVRAGSRFMLSVPVGLPAEVRHALGDLDVAVYVETETEWIERIATVDATAVFNTAATDAGSPADAAGVAIPRVRLVGSRESVAELHRDLARATGGDPDLAVYAGEVTTAGRIELLPFVHEQSITITAHRFGEPDPWSEAVI